MNKQTLQSIHRTMVQRLNDVEDELHHAKYMRDGYFKMTDPTLKSTEGNYKLGKMWGNKVSALEKKKAKLVTTIKEVKKSINVYGKVQTIYQNENVSYVDRKELEQAEFSPKINWSKVLKIFSYIPFTILNVVVLYSVIGPGTVFKTMFITFIMCLWATFFVKFNDWFWK